MIGLPVFVWFSFLFFAWAAERSAAAGVMVLGRVGGFDCIN